MTTATLPSTVVTRNRVGLLDVVWLAWRQHRIAILTTTVAVLALSGWTVWNTQQLAAAWPHRPADELGRSAITKMASITNDQVELVAVFAGLIAVFWAAPLLAREYEQRTHLLAWSQDVSRGRWLLGKVLTLGAVAVGLALLLGVIADHAVGTVIATNSYTNLFIPFSFEAYPLLQVGYALFGFALGLLCSAVFRHLLPATTVTLVVFALARVAVAQVRLDYLPPVRQITPFTGMFTLDTGPGSLIVGNGYLTSSGQSADQLVQSCVPLSGTDFQQGEWQNCLRQHGVTQQYTDYRPASQIPTFRLIEVGIFLALTVICAVATWQVLRRRQTV